MATLRRQMADLLEKVSGARIVRPERFHTVFEEEHLKRFFRDFEVDCVFDVGANTGQYAERLRQRIGFEGPIVSFEPIPELAELLARKAANSPGWYVRDVALDTKAGHAQLNVMAGKQFSSLLEPDHSQVDVFKNKNRITATVDVIVSTVQAELADCRQRLGFKRPFLKMDTQGKDLAVAEGAGESLSAFVGIQSEIAIKRIYKGSADSVTALAYYQRRGFEISAFVPNNGGHFPRLVEMDCILYRKDLVL